jgi:hypothetical protein
MHNTNWVLDASAYLPRETITLKLGMRICRIIFLLVQKMLTGANMDVLDVFEKPIKSQFVSWRYL